MQYRVGTCQACGATFKVAATFQGDKAKCKSCAGVVHVGPVLSAADEAAKPAPAAQSPTPAPARVERGAKAAAKTPSRPVASKKPAPVAPKAAAKPAPKPPAKPAAKAPEPELVEYKPSGKTSAGPSMKERLLAARGDVPAPAQPVPARKVAPAPAAKPAPAKPAAKAPAARAAAPKAAAGKAAAAAPAAERAGRAKPAAGGARGKAGARAASTADEAGARRRGGRSGGHDKKKSPLPIVAALVGLAAVGFGAWKFVLQKPAETVEAHDTDTAAAPQGPAVDVPDTTPAEARDTDTTTEAVDETPAPAAAAAPVEKTLPDPEPAAVDEGPDLSLLEPFGPDAGTTEEQWAEIQSDVDLVADPSAGAAGNRARLRLEKVGRPAFPAIVNKMLTLDYATDDGYRNGDLLQQTLSFIANGKNAGWKYSTSDEDVRFNKKAVALLHKVWNRAKDDEAYWLNYSKQDKKDAQPAEEAAKEGALSDDDLDDLDDLDGL